MDNKNLFYAFLGVLLILIISLSVNFVSGAPTVVDVRSPVNDTWNLTTNTIWFDYTCGGNATYPTNFGWNVSLWMQTDGSNLVKNQTICANATGSGKGGCLESNVTNYTWLGIEENPRILWHIQCVGNSTTGDMNSTIRTLGIDTVDPSITLDSPGNDSWNLSTSINFTFTVTDANLAGCNLTIDGAYNVSNASVIPNATGANFSMPPEIGDSTRILWNVQCWDKARPPVRASGNFTLKIDTINPTGSIDMPKQTNIFAQRPITLRCDGSDLTAGVDYVKLKITKPSGKLLEYNLVNNADKIIRGVDTGEAGKYLIDCKVYDNVNKTYDTGQKEFNVYYRTVKSGEAEEPGEEITPGEEEAEGVPTEGVPTEKAPIGKAWIWIVVVVVIVLILYFVLKKKK